MAKIAMGKQNRMATFLVSECSSSEDPICINQIYDIFDKDFERKC